MKHRPSLNRPAGRRSEGAKAWRLRLGVAVAGTVLAPIGQAAPPTVLDGYRVDADTYAGYRIWKTQNCGGCHGAEQQGLSGPALTESLARLTKEEFVQTVLQGRPAKRMPAFGHLPSVANQIEHLYSYLKGRADGVITRAQVEPLP